MAFPSDHAYPAELPCWLLEGHELTAGERIAVTAYDQGEDRHREIRTFTPYLATVSTFLTQTQFDRFDEWYESDIQAGSLRFDTKVMSLEGFPGQWWQAQFLGSYRYEAQHLDRFIVSADLILLDGPYDVEDEYGDPVRIAPSLFGRAIGESDATGALLAGTMFGWSVGDSEGWAIQSNGMYGRSEGESELTGEMAPTSFLLLPDGVSYLLLPDAVSRLALPE
jgi:hypothetical protein